MKPVILIVVLKIDKQLKQIIQIEQNIFKESQLAGGKPAGYLQAWPRYGTWYRERTIVHFICARIEVAEPGVI